MVAFAYAPVPYTVNPFLTSSSKHPDYLIHKAHAAGRGRARGGVLSPASPMTRKSISEIDRKPFRVPLMMPFIDTHRNDHCPLAH